MNVKQIESGSDAGIETSLESSQTNSSKPKNSSGRASSSRSPNPVSSPKQVSPASGLQKAFVLAIATAVSATLGLTAALLLPLPIGLVAKDKSANSLDLWQVGLGYRVGRPVNVLVMGIDRVPTAKEGSKEMFSGNSDTMLLLRVDPTQDDVNLISIPRDTQVDIPGVGVTKINDANMQGGATLAARTVSATLNGITIDRYVRISTDAFRELIDLLGGVEINVPKRMVYEDKTQKLKIDLQPGLQTLNGSQAEQYARFRHDDLGDIGRVQRQQALLKELRKKLTNPLIIPRIPGLIQAMQKHIDTNLSMEEMLALVGSGRKLSEGKFKMVMLPGRFSSPAEFVASYWILDPAGRDRVMQQYFGIDPAVSSAPASAAPASSAPALRIAVENASSNPKAAAQMKQFLSKLGYQDVYIAEDAAVKQDDTEVIPQRGDLSSAQDMQKALGLGRVEAESTGDLESDITIRVGEDWGSRK